MVSRFWHHSVVIEVFSKLPPHERRRLRALGEGDLEVLARRRLAGEPLQYIEGKAAFLDFEVQVNPRVLVPRPETEGLFELISRSVSQPATVVDLGTGSGVLAIAAARRYGRASVYAVDVSGEALEVARENSGRIGVQVDFHQGDLFDALPSSLAGSVDLVMSNPPYVPTEAWSSLPEDVRREPRLALDGGPGGFAVLERIARLAGDWIAPGAMIVAEMDETHAKLASEAFGHLGEVTIHRDLANRVRYVKVAP